MPIGSDFLRTNSEQQINLCKEAPEQDSTDKSFCYEKIFAELYLAGKSEWLYEYSATCHTSTSRKSIFPHQWKNLTVWNTGKRKKKSIVKRLFHRSSQSVCFKTRQLDKQKTQKQKMIKGSVSSPSNW